MQFTTSSSKPSIQPSSPDRSKPSPSVAAEGCITKVPSCMRSVHIDKDGTRVEYHCNGPVKTDCTIKDCGHDFSDAGVFTHLTGPDHGSITYRKGDEVYGMRALGETDCSHGLDPPSNLIIEDFEASFYAEKGWDTPRRIPQVDELRKLEEANSMNDGTGQGTEEAEDEEQENQDEAQ